MLRTAMAGVGHAIPCDSAVELDFEHEARRYFSIV